MKRPTDRPKTTALYHWRTVQIGLSFEDLFLLRKGEVLDMFVESMNDREKYNEQATQDDFDAFN